MTRSIYTLVLLFALTACVTETDTAPADDLAELDYDLIQQELATCADDEDIVLESDTCAYSLRGVDVTAQLGYNIHDAVPEFRCHIYGWALWRLDAGAACDGGTDAHGTGFEQATCDSTKTTDLGELRTYPVTGDTPEQALEMCKTTSADHILAMQAVQGQQPPNEQVQLLCCVKRTNERPSVTTPGSQPDPRRVTTPERPTDGVRSQSDVPGTAD